MVTRTERIGSQEPGIYVPVSHAMPIDTYSIPEGMKPFLASILLSDGQVTDRIERVAEVMYDTLSVMDKPIVFLTTLKSANYWGVALKTAYSAIGRHRQNTSKTMYYDAFITCKSVGDHGERYEAVSVIGDEDFLKDMLRDKHVVILEDILDTGNTLEALHQWCSNLGAASVQTFVVLAKRCPTWNGYVPEWVCFDIDDYFIVGGTCDLSERFRDLQAVCIFKPELIDEYLS